MDLFFTWLMCIGMYSLKGFAGGIRNEAWKTWKKDRTWIDMTAYVIATAVELFFFLVLVYTLAPYFIGDRPGVA